jgi:pilus assembly protein FimV
VLSDSDLANMDIAGINKHLQNRFGDNRSNIKVNSGKTVPFFIVFNRLPPDLDEYTVEVAGSSS